MSEKFTSRRKNAILRKMRDVHYAKTAAETSGITEQTLYNWLKKDEEPEQYPELAAIDRASKQLELLGRLRGELSEAVVNLHLHPEWLELRTVIVGALLPHPEARRAVLAAIERRQADGRT